jgi:hypothetical protein
LTFEEFRKMYSRRSRPIHEAAARVFAGNPIAARGILIDGDIVFGAFAIRAK